MTKKIVLIGGYGGADIGDEAMPATVIINLRKIIPDIQFLALSPDPTYTSKYHKVESDYWIEYYLTGSSLTGPSATRKAQPNIFLRVFKFSFNLLIRLLRGFDILFNAWIFKKYKRTIFLNDRGKQLLNHLNSADLLFNVGGGNINSKMCAPWCLCNRFIVYWICKILEKPVIASGQTIAPIDNKWIDKKIARFFLNKVDVITLRDVTSMGILKDIGVTKPIIKETGDDAVLLPAISMEEVKKIFLAEKIEVYHPLIGFNMKGFLKYTLSGNSFGKLGQFNQVMAETADRLISELGAKIIFIPTDYGVNSDDRPLMAEVLKLMKQKSNANILMNEYDGETLKGVIGQMDLVIGARYHFIVFATTMQVPSIGIAMGEYQLAKLKGILTLMEQEKYYLDFEKTSVEEIVALVKDALQNKDEIRKKLEERTKILGERSLFTIEYAKKLLTTETQVK